MKKYTPWIDIAIYGSIIILMLGAILLAALTEQEWSYEKIIAISVVPTVIICICLAILLEKIFSKPTYITKHGIVVWSGVFSPAKGGLEKFIDFYIEKLPTLWSYIEKEDLIKMFNGAKIEFTNNLTSFFGIGWTAMDKGGFQRQKNVKVGYNGGKLWRAELAHAFHHMIDEVVFEIDPDHAHKNVLWWYTVSMLTAEYEYRQ